MKIIEDDYAVRLKSGAAMTCLCWKFERKDGQVYGATDHDKSLRVDNIQYLPDRALDGAEFVSNAGLAPGHVTGRGALSASFLTEDDLALGLWDGTRVTVWRVDWQRPELRYHVWSGYLGEVKHSDQNFQVELVSLKSQLEKRIGRVYTRQCDAELGDVRCGVNTNSSAYRRPAIIAEILSPNRLQIDDLSAFPTGWFSNGVIELSEGRKLAISKQENDQISLYSDVSIEVGTNVHLIAGCDKSYDICKSKFSNHINFQGFPHLPGMDAVLSGPSASDINDGGKR